MVANLQLGEVGCEAVSSVIIAGVEELGGCGNDNDKAKEEEDGDLVGFF